MDGKALTPEAAKLNKAAEEIARGYLAEWATFDSEDAEAYKKRLAPYAEGDISPPKGTQKCNNVTIVDIKSADKKNKLFRIKADLHVSRLVAVNESEIRHISEARIVAPVAQTNEENSETKYLVWQETVVPVEVSVKAEKTEVSIIGPPTLVPREIKKGNLAREMITGKEAPEDFTVFVEQSMHMYFEGQDMANFIDSDSGIRPVGCYKVNDVRIEDFKGDDTGVIAVVDVDISTTGLENQKLQVVIEAHKKDKWLLTRIGSW